MRHEDRKADGMPARKRSTAKKSSAKKSAKKTGVRRKSTAAPKRIINRKKSAAKRGAAKKSTASKREGSAKKILERYNEEGARVVELIDKKGMAIGDAAKKLKMSKGKAIRLYARATVNPRQRVVGTDAEVGKAIVKMRDSEGLKWMPDIWARTGLRPAKAKALYKAAGGKGATSNGAGAKKAGMKKATAKAARAKATASGRKSAAKAMADATQRAGRKRKAAKGKAGGARPKGRKARREASKALLNEVIWNNDTSEKEVSEALTGRTIEVTREINGRSMKPLKHRIKSVKEVTVHDQHGRVIEFIDEDGQDRFVSAREITALN